MQRIRPVTLQDVATASGVSVATVSKALNGTGRLSDETRVRVAGVATQLGFRPNPLARSLVTGRASTVGMLIRDSRVERFALPIMVGAEEALGDLDLSLIVCDAHGDPARLTELITRLNQRSVDGVLVVGENTAIHPSVTSTVSAAAVYVYHVSDDPSDVSHVPDDQAGAELVASHLVDTGRRRIVHITGPRNSRPVAARVRGLRRVLKEHRLALPMPVEYGPWSQRRGRELASRLVASGVEFDAVMCGSDQLAHGVVDGLLTAGRRVPDDVAVTGFDNWVEFAEDGAPELTTVDMNLHALGAAAARDLLSPAAARGRDRGIRTHPCSLVVRGSTV